MVSLILRPHAPFGFYKMVIIDILQKNSTHFLLFPITILRELIIVVCQPFDRHMPPDHDVTCSRPWVMLRFYSWVGATHEY